MTEPFTRRLPVVSQRRADGSLECTPRFVVWEVTLRCDQACRFCGTRAGRPREDELSTVEALDLVRQVAAMGTKEVALHGGETYLREDWLEIVRAVRDHGMDCTMVTGGRGMTPERARAARDAGIHAVSVSIDGLEATHDALRGLRGSRASALRAVAALQDAGVRVGCNTQLNQRNYRELQPLAEELGRLGLYGWQVQLMIPMGRAADASELWLQPYDLLHVIPEVAAARARCDALGLRLWPGDNVGYFGPYEHLLRRERARGAHSGGCGGGIVTLGIEANGDVKGCSAMATEGFVAGNVRERSIASMWEHAAELRFTRDFVVDDLWGACRTCYYADVCKGGCVWTASALLGKRGNNPYCHHRALELLAAGKRERLELVRAAAGLIRDRARFELHVEDAPPEWVVSLPSPRQLAPVSGGGP